MRTVSLVGALILATWLASAAPASQQGLTVSTYNNTAWWGEPATQTIAQAVGFVATLPSSTGSVEQTGTLTLVHGQSVRVSCVFGAGIVFGMLHLDDHLICQTGANTGTNCGPPGTPHRCNGTDNPLPVMTRTQLPLRLAVVYSSPAATTATVTVAVSLTVSSSQPSAPVSAGLNLSPSLPALESERRRMQQGLLQGWAPWMAMSYLDHVLLPHGARIRLALCELTAPGRCLTEARIDWPDPSAAVGSSVRTSSTVGSPAQGWADIRLGPHAYDRSYAVLHIGLGACNLSVASSGGASGQLLLLVDEADGSACDGNYALVPVGLSTWFRANQPSLSGNASLRFESAGLSNVELHASRPSDCSISLPPSAPVGPRLVFRLGGDAPAVGLYAAAPGSSAPGLPLEAIKHKLDLARAAEMARYTAYGQLAETKLAVQAAVMWQTIWNPLEQGPLAPVIRGNPWGLDHGTVNDDWPYVVFDWDNHFGSLMLSQGSRELGYSALIQVVKAKTAGGYVPNTASSVNKARHSQPPVGGKVLLEMYRKYGDQWVVELLFDDLIDWNNWFESNRLLSPLGIVCLGSAEGDMQDARFESGLDDSPMYDDNGETCDNKTRSCGPWKCTEGEAGKQVCGAFREGKMQLYDVGMASMHAMDSAALATLGEAIGRPAAEVAMLRVRANRMSGLIEAHLWDEQSGAFVNRIPDGSFVRRVSPTSFYPLQTGAPADDRARRMALGWLLNSSRFCLSPNGDFAGNSDSCYWGLPSISADDDAYPALGYWRGYVWGPMAQLTYWGLQNYDHVPEVRTARLALCKQMNAMMLSQWTAHRHICENFYPHRQETPGNGCSPGAMRMYHWGALSGFISLVEAGFY